MADAEDRERAERAASLLSHPLWQEAWVAFDARCVSKWRNADDAAEREFQWLYQRAGREVRDHIERIFKRGLVE